MTQHTTKLSRRRFLELTGVGGLGLALSPPRALATRPEVVAEEPWGRIAKLADKVWGVVSTPLESSDWTTGCNGGLVAGTKRVLAIDSFLRPQGAAWVASNARELTGRRPTDGPAARGRSRRRSRPGRPAPGSD